MESEIIRRDIPVNTFHVNSKTSRRLNWKYAMDLALKDLARIEERHQGEDFPIYKIQSAEPEVRMKSSSTTTTHAASCSHPLLRLSVRRITNSKMIQMIQSGLLLISCDLILFPYPSSCRNAEYQPAIADHLPTTAQAHVVLTQHSPKVRHNDVVTTARR